MLIKFGDLKKNGPNAFKLMLQRMGGSSISSFEVLTGANENVEDPDDMIAGYDARMRPVSSDC